MIDFVGELPLEWQPKWEQLRGDIKLGEKGQRSKSTLEQKFDGHVSEPDLKVLLPVIKGLTRFLPEDRVSASQALDLIRDKCTDRDSKASDDELVFRSWYTTSLI